MLYLIDARVIGPTIYSGIELHAFEIIRNMIFLDKKIAFTILIKKNSILYNALKEFSNVKFVYSEINPYSLISTIYLSYKIFILKPNLFYSPTFIGPLFSKSPIFLTLHDLIHIKFPDSKKSIKYFIHLIYYHFFLRLFFKNKKNFIITVSKISKNDLASFFSLEKARIQIIYNGLSEIFFKEKSNTELEKNEILFNFPEQFILASGNPKRHKNLPLLIEAYLEVKTEEPLVIISKPLGVYKNVYFISPKTEEELCELYRKCIFFVFPTRMEGFGIPPLEALSQGKTILVSDIPILREILHDYAIFFDSSNKISLIKSLSKTLERRLVHKKPQKNFFNSFSWQKSSRSLLEWFSLHTKK